MKKRIALVLTALLLILSLALSGCNLLDGLLPKDIVKGGTVSAVVKLDFDPSVLISLNSSGTVTGVAALNDEAIVMLYDEDSIVDVPLADSIKKIIAAAAKVGYIDHTYNAVNVAVLATDDQKALVIESDVSVAIEDACSQRGFSSTIVSDLDYSAKKEFLAFRELHSYDSYSNIDTTTFDFAYALAKYNNTAAIDEIELDRADMIAKLGELCLNQKNYETEKFRLEKKTADTALEREIASELERLWLARYREEKNQVKGAAYELFYFDFVYQTAQLKQIAELVEYLDVVEYLVFDSAKVSELLAAFGLPETARDRIANINSNVTVDSVEQYANLLYKNNISFNSTKIDSIINEFNNNVNDLKNRFVNQRQDEIGAAIAEIKSLASQVRLEESDPVIYESIVELADDFETFLLDGEFSFSDMKSILTDLDSVSASIISTAKDALSGFESDLEIAEKNKLAELQKTDSQLMLEHNSKVKKAKNAEREHIKSTKNDLRAKVLELN